MKNKRLFLCFLSASCLSGLIGCAVDEPYMVQEYMPNDQIQRQWKRLNADNVGVAQVRVVKEIETDCANFKIPIPNRDDYKTNNAAFAAYWKKALEMDLRASGALNETDPKVKLYALLDSVKIQGEPTNLAWRFNIRMFSSNGGMLSEEIVYHVPTDNLKNMTEGCRRIAADMNKAVAWSIVRTISDPKFSYLVQPGLGYVPSMKGQSITKSINVFSKDEEDEYWKTKPHGGEGGIEPAE